MKGKVPAFAKAKGAKFAPKTVAFKPCGDCPTPAKCKAAGKCLKKGKK